MHTFLPENYEAPRVGGFYMKIQPGENKIRILSKAIVGWEDWNKDGKPVRFAYNDKPEKPFNAEKPIRHFWAFIVWNYAEEAIQILQVTQSGIRKGIEALCNDSDWGAPYYYDIKIIKSGEELKTKYQVNPLPHKPLSAQMIDGFKNRPIYLEALFVGEDPFSGHWPNKTPLMVENQGKKEEVLAKTQPKLEDIISDEQAQELNAILATCGTSYRTSVMKTLSDAVKIKDLKELPTSWYQKVRDAAIRKRDEFNAKSEQRAFA